MWQSIVYKLFSDKHEKIRTWGFSCSRDEICQSAITNSSRINTDNKDKKQFKAKWGICLSLFCFFCVCFNSHRKHLRELSCDFLVLNKSIRTLWTKTTLIVWCRGPESVKKQGWKFLKKLLCCEWANDEGLTLETSALYSLRWPIYIFNLVDTTKLLC